jgi:16S rRNA (cytosine967-C5)-methyltransferase
MRARSSGRPRPGAEARALALRVVRRVTERGAYSNLALAGELERSDLVGRDRQFAADLAYGTLRKLLVLDSAIGAGSSRPIERMDREVLALLRLGAYQLLYSRVPSHAAVGETVALASSIHRGFVNAVLRRISRHPPGSAQGDGDAAISARTGLASWAVAELRRVLPDEVEEAAAALASPADLSLRANRCRASVGRLEAALRSAGIEARSGLHHPDVLVVRSVTPSGLPGYGQGWFSVQDEASALVAEAVGAAPGERVLDACAGPGGKAAHLACKVGSEGLVVGGDANPRRAGLVRATAERLGVRVEVVAADACRPPLAGPFDAVLVDAPCSGLGAARRRPELLWRPRKESLARLARLQVAILTGAAGLLRPGGRLVYSVCTFPRAETDAVVRAFRSRNPDFEPVDVPGPDGPRPVHRLWPHRHGTDAMFYASFRRG